MPRFRFSEFVISSTGKTVARKRDVTYECLNTGLGPRYSSIAQLKQHNFCTKRPFNKHVKSKYNIQNIFFRKNTDNLLINAAFLIYCKSREFCRKSLTFHAHFRKIHNYFEFFRNSCKNIEVKLVKKIGDYHRFYEIGLENKKFSEKFREF